jgi:alkaline phosphatase D
MPSRRAFLSALAALGFTRALPAYSQPRVRFSSDPFKLGVASGYPAPDGVVLWTRLVADPLQPDGGLEPATIPVRWEIARDERFSSIAASGTADASPEWAHSVHVEARGLEPDRWYWYRFTAGDAQSAPARTRTAPSANAAVERLKFAVASCQQFEQGWYGAYRHIVADAPDLIAFLGDYIYESSWGKVHVRKHDRRNEALTLDDYRSRHAHYKSDPDLQAAHAACPWILTWDDHEVNNDYADDLPEFRMPKEKFLARRAVAYRAYYEHMPLPSRMRPDGPRMRIYTQLGWGALARFFVLDDRQYRSYHACRRLWRPGEGKAVTVAECPALGNPNRSILGRAQERWLEDALGDSRAAWNVLAQQTRIAQFDELPGPGRRAWTDSWDGYPAARQRLLDFLADRSIANPVTIGGDIHAFNVADLKRDFDDPASPVVASEFVGTSISSEGWAQENYDRFLPDNPHMKLADSRHRGYVRVEVTPKALRADLRAMETVQTRDAACNTLATFVVADGKPGPQRA